MLPGRSVDWVRLSLVAFTAVVVLTLLVGTSSSTAAFSTYNTNWEGGSALEAVAVESGARTDVVHDVAAYDRFEPRGTVAVVRSPETTYAPEEAAAIERFVRAGGTLVVMEDFGPHANPLLDAVGANARVDGRLLVDDRYYEASTELPVASNVSGSALVDGVGALTLNRATVLAPNGARVLVSTSPFSSIRPATDRAGAVDAVGPFPVVTVEPVGAGTVIVVSDPSLSINSMLEYDGNKQFFVTLFERHDRVVVDASHAGATPLAGVVTGAVRTSPTLTLLVGGVGVLVIGVLSTRSVRRLGGAERSGSGVARRDGRNADLTEAELVEQLTARHPEWGRDTAERIASAYVHNTRR